MDTTRNGGGEGEREGRTLKSLERSFAIVRELERRDGAGITELADAVDLSKSSVHKHLATLQAGDFVTKDGDRYKLGLRFLELGGYVREQTPGNTLVQTKLREIAAESGETVQFTVEEHGRAVVLYRETGNHGVFSRGRVGKRFYMHQTAAGKAILSQMPESAVHDVVERHGLPAATEETITSVDALLDELERTRERGYALNVGESTKGLYGVAVPITAPDDSTLGAFAVAGPIHRLTDGELEDDIPNLIHRRVNELELNLAHS
ncbi:IclR family transcriptional regulator [Haloarchaeobius sp. TZWWS8]|uniref:IclR family transcriptional regulator n=1 Tax=Haloarchaeobius sp. TZWWS8 TaxID=3446121 RepID=UPI003EBE65F3